MAEYAAQPLIGTHRQISESAADGGYERDKR
ncbi:hypothetical protein J2W91_004746 [Paenibacillus amylolyticus]|uniref:Uncharacterized protein n=1 Tax=Paenibacillus amylolyticus TaxID=1451 RepID=A0AAP5H6R8_PAEAM|nr:hypothetical protein [Paenibacillus amylolyticus]